MIHSIILSGLTDFYQSALFSFVVLPLFIIIARICDVSMDTIRVIFVSKGFRKVAPVIGFFQALIWLIAVVKIMQNLDNWMCYVAYATGFALGNYLGMWLEEKIGIGIELIRVISSDDTSDLVDDLREKGYGVTLIGAAGKDGKVNMFSTIAKRTDINGVLETIQHYNPDAFYTVEDVRHVNKQFFHNPDGTDTMQRKWFLNRK
jgi:uncharacterized protein YebE (UPF0316 family)